MRCEVCDHFNFIGNYRIMTLCVRVRACVCVCVCISVPQTTFKGRVFMTHATKAIYRWLLSDYIKVR